MKKKLLTGLIVIVFASFCACFFLISEMGSTYYYSQIDNSKMAPGEPRNGVIDFDGGMNCLYTLFSYDENGKGKEIKFGTSRELREGAFIRLKVMPIRGVLEWKEVQYDELPAAVQSKYTDGR